MIFGFDLQTNIWNGGTVGKGVKMMFSSKAEERVDKKDMVSNVFACLLLQSSVSSSYYNFIYLFVLRTGPFCNFCSARDEGWRWSLLCSCVKCERKAV